MDSPCRQAVPKFGAWRQDDPGSPAIDYTEVFARARASRLGSMPPDHYVDDYYYQPSAAASYSSENRSTTSLTYLHNRQSRKNFLQYFVCGARAEQ